MNRTVLFILFLPLLSVVWSCDDDLPPVENEEELITDLVLTFTPVSAGEVQTAMASDPDGLGPEPMTVTKDITLVAGTSYTLQIGLSNEINSVDMGAEIEAEADEHKFFFAFSENLFDSPTGNGNIDVASDPINYLDSDINQLPLGISTSWTTVATPQTGTFKILLKHQPGIKTETSSVADGETDVEFEWNLTIN